MYKFKITVRKGCLKGLEFGKVCADFLKNYQIRTKKNTLKTVNPPLILPAVRVLALFKVQVLPLKSCGL